MERDLMSNLPIEHCAVVMDFAENIISLVPKDEIESCHWTTKQVTLHPIHIVRLAPDSTSDKPVIMQESLIIISDSLAHNANAVYIFTNQLILHVEENTGPFKIKVLHRFSDNCTTQYKCKDAFMHMSELESAHNIQLFYHHTESGHGKGPSEAHGAAVKKRLERLILGGGLAVNNAYQTYLSLSQSQSELTNQRIMYEPQKIIKKASPKAFRLSTLPGPQKFHMVSTKPGYPGVLVCNELSCTCLVCIADQQGPC